MSALTKAKQCTPRISMPLFLVTCVGAVLEFYDFAIVLMLANNLAKVFLPEQTTQPFLWVFAIFALGYFVRPIGGALFSHIGDRIGRKPMFRLSIMLISGATLGIALLPGYNEIGAFSTALLIAFRILQGISVGGELPGAIVFAAEHVSPTRRGFVTSSIIAAASLGLVLAAATGFLINHFLSEEQVLAWGWRLPFLFGSLVGVLSYILRKNIEETPIFQALEKTKDLPKVPAMELFRQKTRTFLLASSLTAVAGTFSAVYLFIPSFTQRYFHLPAQTSYFYSMLIIFVVVLLTMFFGWLSDFYGRRVLLRIGSLWILLAALPATYLLSSGHLYSGALLLAAPAAMINGCYQAAIIELFHTRIRFTGLALSHNIGMSIFNGLSPMAMEKLAEHGVLAAPIILMCIAASITLFGSLKIPCRYRVPLDVIEQADAYVKA